MDVLPHELLGEVASFLAIDETSQLFATCKAASAIRDDKRAYAMFLLRCSAETALDDLTRALVKHNWPESDVLCALRTLLTMLSKTASCDMLAVKSASLGYTQVLRCLPRLSQDAEALALQAAGSAGFLPTVQFLISDQGCSPLSIGAAPLLATASAGQVDALQFMLRHCAAIPSDVEEPLLNASLLHEACLISALQHLPDGPSHAKDVALLQAARRGIRSSVVLLIEAQADVHAMQDEALCEAQDTEVIKALLEHGADVHAQQECPLLAACTHGHEEIVELLISHGADLHAKDDAALVKAACEGHAATVRLLLACGARVAAQQGLPLIRAAAKGFEEVVEVLLAGGADVHAQYDSALVAATRGGHEGVVNRLLDGGADVNAEDSGALCAAVLEGHSSLVQLLLQRGADVHMVEEDLEALCHAAEANDVATLKLLLDAGLCIPNCGNSAALLVAAARAGARDAAVLLLAAGACFSEAEQVDHPERLEAVDRLIECVA